MTGTGVGRVQRAALVSIARRTGVSGLSRVAWVSITRRTGISRVSRIARISVARLRIARISVNRIGWVAVIGARWGWRCSSESPKYPGCPSDRCSKGGSWPASRRSSNGSAGSRSQYSSTKAALDGIIGVCAGREAQREDGDYTRRSEVHCRFPLGRQPGRVDDDNGYIAPSLPTKPALRLCEPEGLAAVALENSLAEPVRADLVETVKIPCPRRRSLTSGPQNGLQTLGSRVRSGYTRPERCQTLEAHSVEVRGDSARQSLKSPGTGPRL